jgi:5-methylcytosine-specific restriction endonuclease McrA
MPSTDKAKIKERKRKYWLANREKLLARQKAYRKAKPEIGRAKQKKYWARNPEKAQAFNRQRRARVNNVEHIPYTKEEVLKKYGADCHICGSSIDLKAPRKAGKKGWEHGLHLDHLIPISKGGPDTIENVRPAHGLCNLSKGARGE